MQNYRKSDTQLEANSRDKETLDDFLPSITEWFFSEEQILRMRQRTLIILSASEKSLGDPSLALRMAFSKLKLRVGVELQ